MGVSLNGGTPHFTPQNVFFLVRKPNGCWVNPPFWETPIWMFPKILVPQNG